MVLLTLAGVISNLLMDFPIIIVTSDNCRLCVCVCVM